MGFHPGLHKLNAHLIIDLYTLLCLQQDRKIEMRMIPLIIILNVPWKILCFLILTKYIKLRILVAKRGETLVMGKQKSHWTTHHSFYNGMLDTFWPGELIFRCHIFLPFYTSWSSWGKNTRVICHSLLQWAMLIQYLWLFKEYSSFLFFWVHIIFICFLL